MATRRGDISSGILTLVKVLVSFSMLCLASGCVAEPTTDRLSNHCVGGVPSAASSADDAASHIAESPRMIDRCVTSDDKSPELGRPSGPVSDPTNNVTVTGIRVTQGNAVTCPQIRDDNGVLHTVSYLSPDILIGDGVTVSGFYAITTHCIGKVIVAEKELRLQR